MTTARSTQVSLSDTPWYHVVSRCVRRAYLCGEDRVSGQNFEHRRQWLVDWIMRLSGVFAIDVAAYAIMSNHYHIVVRIDAQRAKEWSADEVLRRWTSLFAGGVLVQRYLSDARATMDASLCAKVMELAEDYRKRLIDLSWFMRILNENIAREANREDGAKGRFWEGRFKSQALLDDIALLSAMAYVDLNPVRAGIADTPETSDFTSIQQRIAALVQHDESTEIAAEVETAIAAESSNDELAKLPQAPLMPFEATGQFEQSIPFSFSDYLELVDMVGRVVHPQKRGSIPADTPAILQRLGIDAEAFILHASRFLKEFAHAIGRPDRLIALADKRQTRYLRGISTARALCERRVA